LAAPHGNQRRDAAGGEDGVERDLVVDAVLGDEPNHVAGAEVREVLHEPVRGEVDAALKSAKRRSPTGVGLDEGSAIGPPTLPRKHGG
jgi:hypothetical protein